MSPEQVRGQETDHRADIFAFGVILYEMLSGQRAFRGDSASETMSAILKEEPPEFAQTNGANRPAIRNDHAAVFGKAAGNAVFTRRAISALRLNLCLLEVLAEVSGLPARDCKRRRHCWR